MPSSPNRPTFSFAEVDSDWTPRVSTHPMAFILFTVNCRPVDAWSTESRRGLTREPGRDLKPFSATVKAVFVAKSTRKVRAPSSRIWWVSTGRSARMPAWSRSTLDPEGRASLSSFQIVSYDDSPSLGRCILTAMEMRNVEKGDWRVEF